MDTNEAELIRKAQAGDTAAFGSLYDAYISRIYRLAWYKTHHRETAEDITSIAFAKAFEKLGTFDAGRGNFSGWLYRIARNAVIDHYRSRKDVRDIEDAWDLAADVDIPRDVESRTMLELLQAHLIELSADQRDVIVMRLWEGMSYAEIAAALDKSEPACRMAFARGTSRLRELMPLMLMLMLLTEL